MSTQKHPHLNVFIGYDERQDLAYRVCKHSILKHASQPLTIYPLKHRELREIGLLNREWKVQKDGHTIDLGDNRPFSTNFAFSRFLVPAYSRYLGCGTDEPSIFVDSDFVFLSDLYGIYNEVNIGAKALWCVKHNYSPASVIKMDNQVQTPYNKKLWSSFMLFNTWRNSGPSVEEVNTGTGAWLHGFNWLPEASVGSLYEGWNFIPDHSEVRVKEQNIRAIHFTEGTPMMKPGCRYAEIYNNELREVLQDSIIDLEKLN